MYRYNVRGGGVNPVDSGVRKGGGGKCAAGRARAPCVVTSACRGTLRASPRLTRARPLFINDSLDNIRYSPTMCFTRDASMIAKSCSAKMSSAPVPQTLHAYIFTFTRTAYLCTRTHACMYIKYDACITLATRELFNYM